VPWRSIERDKTFIVSCLVSLYFRRVSPPPSSSSSSSKLLAFSALSLKYPSLPPYLRLPDSARLRNIPALLCKRCSCEKTEHPSWKCSPLNYKRYCGHRVTSISNNGCHIRLLSLYLCIDKRIRFAKNGFSSIKKNFHFTLHLIDRFEGDYHRCHVCELICIYIIWPSQFERIK